MLDELSSGFVTALKVEILRNDEILMRKVGDV